MPPENGGHPGGQNEKYLSGRRDWMVTIDYDEMNLLQYKRMLATISTISMVAGWSVFSIKIGASLLGNALATGLAGLIGGFVLEIFVLCPHRENRHHGSLDPCSVVPVEGPVAALAQTAFILPVAINAFAILILLGTTFSPKYVEWVMIATPIFAGGQWGTYFFVAGS